MLVARARSLVVTGLLFAAGGLMLVVSAAWGHEGGILPRTDAPAGLRVAIVDTRKASAARDAQRRLLIAQLSLAASRSAGEGQPKLIEAVCVGASAARARFLTGASDAVLVLAEERPFSLRRLDALTHCGALDPEWGVNRIYLIVDVQPNAAQALLARAFKQLLGDRAALRAILAAGKGDAGATVPPAAQ